MAVIKVACPKCGQKVSGDESFFGRTVNCPICTAKIVFPDRAPAAAESASHPSFPSAFEPVPPAGSSVPSEPDPGPAYPEPPSRPEPVAPSFEEHPVSGSGPADETPAPAGETVDPAPPNPTPLAAESEVPSPLLGAIALVTGILNTVTLCLLSLVLAPTAIILGHIALAKAKHSPVKPAPGQSLALIGVILGYAGVVFTIIVLLLVLIFEEPLRSASPAVEG